MKKVYITKPGQRDPISTSEDALRTLWDRGLLSEDLLYWQSDLNRWTPVSESFYQKEPFGSSDRFHPPLFPNLPNSGVSQQRRRPERRFSLMEPGAHPRPPLLAESRNRDAPPTRTGVPAPRRRISHLDLSHYLLTVMLTVIVLGLLVGSSRGEFRWLAITAIFLITLYLAAIAYVALRTSEPREPVGPAPTDDSMA